MAKGHNGHFRSFLTVFRFIGVWRFFLLFLGLKTGKYWKNDVFSLFFCQNPKNIEKSYVKISNVQQRFEKKILGFWPMGGVSWVKMDPNHHHQMRLNPLNPKMYKNTHLSQKLTKILRFK